MVYASEVLCAKARRAWFSMSSIIYKDKKISMERTFQLFDSLVTPVALYGSEFWLPHILPQKSFKSYVDLLDFWEKLK